MKNLIFILALAITACSTSSQKENSGGESKAIEKLDVTAFHTKLKESPDAILLDVRTPGEYQAGHIRNAFLANWSNEAEFKTRVEALDKKRPVYTYCLSGARSNAATQYLRENGFTAFNLSGGTLAWRNAGKALEQSVVNDNRFALAHARLAEAFGLNPTIVEESSPQHSR